MIETIGWMLVHVAWQGGLIAAVLAVLLWLMRDARATSRYAVSLLALLMTVAGPVATTMARHPHSTAGHSRPRVDVSPATPSVAPVAPVVPVAPAARAGAPAATFGLPTGVVRRATDRVEALLPWFVTAWLIGVVALSVGVLGGVARIRMLARRSMVTADARVQGIAARMAARLGLESGFRVLLSREVDVPMVVGWITPAVLVPVGLLSGVGASELEMLLAHELAHIRRHDTLVNLVQTVIDTLLFHHPGVWWISARVREEREHCCDDLAMAVTGTDRETYGAMLLALEESRPPLMLAAAATGGSLLHRVRRILYHGRARVELGASWFAGVATLLVVLLVALPGRSPAIASPVVSSVDSTLQPRTLPMTRLPLLAGATALAVAASHVVTPAPPDFSGRWVPVAQSATIGTDRVTLEDSVFAIEQNAKTVTILQGAKGEAKLTFAIEHADDRSVRLTGPTAVSLGVSWLAFTVDGTTGKPSFRAEWDTSKKKLDIDVGASFSDSTWHKGTITLSMERGGVLLYQLDVPAHDAEPAKHEVQRFRRP